MGVLDIYGFEIVKVWGWGSWQEGLLGAASGSKRRLGCGESLRLGMGCGSGVRALKGLDGQGAAGWE